MEIVTTSLKIIAGIAVVGALVETFVPGIISEKTKGKMSSLTIGTLGILFSCLFLMIFLKFRIREGFEDTGYATRWNRIVTENKIKEVCSLYTEMYEKMYSVEKGAAPEAVKTDAQAREAVDAKFATVMTQKPVNCKQIEQIGSKLQSIDGLFLEIQKAPDTLLVDVYDTASGCLRLLIEKYLENKEAERKQKEGFEDKGLCSDAAATERREYKNRKALSQEAEKCLLVEEIPADKKQLYIDFKLNQIQSTFEKFKKTKQFKDSITKVLEDCTYYRKELEKKAKEAQEMSNKYNF